MPRRMTGAGFFTLLALVLLAPGIALAAAEAPAIMIQLPPTMTPDEVKQLVGELVAIETGHNSEIPGCRGSASNGPQVLQPYQV